MSTIQDLNTARTITYNDEANYAIVFGANAGNITANVDAYASANITQQTTLTSITSPVRDLLLDVQFSNVGNVSMAYVGTYSNIGILQVAPAAWRVNGIRSVAQYTEAFANVKFTDLTGASAITPEYSYVTTVNDQAGNTRAWTTTVNVVAQPVLSITGNVIYNEDTLTAVTVANVVVDPASTVTFRLFANTIPTYGAMSNGVVTGNSIFIDGNAASLNSQITAGGIQFLPASDYTSNVANAINFGLGNTTTIFSTANANIQFGTAHDEYSLTTSYNYTEDDTKQMVFAITDLDTHATGFVSTFTQTSGPTSQFYVNGVAQGYGNAAVLANTKANINVANVSFLPYPDSTDNIGLTYSQVKILPTGNVTQASNIAITMVNTVSHDDYSFAAGTYNEDTLTSLGNTITDTDIRAQSYTVSFQQTAGNIGKFYRSNVLIGNANSTLTISNSKANINGTVSWLPPLDYTGNVTFTYSQSKLNVFGNTNIQANAVTAVYSIGNTNPEISNMTARTVTANTVSNIFATTTPYINDGPDYGQIYTITLNSARGNFGTNTANALLQNTFTSTGNTTTINNLFGNIVFVPVFSATSGNFTYTQSRDGVAQANITANLTVNASALSPQTYTFTTNGSFTPTLNQVLFGNTRILTVGGGGAGNASPNVVPFNNKPGSGGGGGGAAVEIVLNRGSANTLTQVEYRAFVGSGGASLGASGNPSYVDKLTNVSPPVYSNVVVALGGTGGVYDPDNLSPWVSPGGNSFQANGTVILGGASTTAVSNSVKLGGGGAGAGAVGGNANPGDEDAVGAQAGNGGNGIASDISGTTTYYGGGGGGAAGWGATAYAASPPGIGTGGSGGGGSGARTTGPAINATPGTNALGGGGGGGLPGSFTANVVGGSGVVIVSIT